MKDSASEQVLGVTGVAKVGKFTKGELSGTKAEIVVNSLDDIAKHGLKSIDEIVNKAKITSLLELKRIGISSVDDFRSNNRKRFTKTRHTYDERFSGTRNKECR